MSGASYRIRAMDDDEAETVAALVRRVFEAFNSAQYGDNPQRFLDEVNAEAALDLLDDGVLLVAVDIEDEIAGVIALDQEDHIEWLFVDPVHHRRGVAQSLWETLLLWREEADVITVNASDYAEPWYEKMGFVLEPGHKSMTTGAEIKRMVWRRG